MESVRTSIDRVGQPLATTNRYTVLRDGMHWKDADGNWRESKPVITSYANAIVCTGTTWRVILNANLNTDDAVDFELPDKERIVSQPIGIGFYDPETGRSVLLAQVKDCRAQVLSNSIVYADAFEGHGIEAAVVYTYDIGRFAQDVIIVRKPSVSPADFGMGTRTRLEVMTEILESPTPVKTEQVLKRETNPVKRARMIEPDVVNERIRFGMETVMPLGRAFSDEAAQRRIPLRGVPVAKRVVEIEGRTVLIESVEWESMRDKLPEQSRNGTGTNRQAQLVRELPESHAASRETSSFETRLVQVTRPASDRNELAAITRPKGFVIDYEIIPSNGGPPDRIFLAGETYLVESASVEDPLFHGGAIIKFETGASMNVSGVELGGYGPAVWPVSGKAVFTHMDDDSVGATIEGSDGTPGFFAGPAICIEYTDYDVNLWNLDIRHAEVGIAIYESYASYNMFSYLRFSDCDLGIFADGAYVEVLNSDYCNVNTWSEDDNGGGVTEDDPTECSANPDSDYDGLPDEWEMEHFGNLLSGPNDDPDNDGLANVDEHLNDTDPNDVDTDGDGLSDGFEHNATGTDPALADTGNSGTSDAYKDSDGDGLTNLEEFKLGTNPLQSNVASPIFSPSGGSYASAQNVTVTCPTASAVIHYTLNGDEPTESSPTVSSGSTVAVSGNLTLKAKAWRTGWTRSHTQSEGYRIEDPPENEPPTVTILPPDESSFLASDTVEILVEAADSDGSIARIQLYRGNYKVASSTTSPLRYSLDVIPAGTYTFTARAMDDAGAVTIAGPITLTIADSGPVVSLFGTQPFFTSSPGTLVATVVGVNPGALTDLTLNSEPIAPRVGEIVLTVPLTEGENTFTLEATDDESNSAQATTKVYLDSVAPVVAITAPANSSTFATERINVSGTFTETSLKRISVNGVLAFIGSGTFEALNIPLAEGANTITATAEDIAGNETSESISVTGGSSPVAPVKLGASRVGGFVSPQVTFTPAASVPGTLQYVYYDFNGDGVADQTETNLDPINHTYTVAGEYFPVVTIQTTSGRFSSLGGWNSTTADRLRINVQAAPQQIGSAISITDPVDLKTTANGHLYVLSRSQATIYQYDSGHSLVRSKTTIGSTPTGLDVDADGNVYVALSGDDQVVKFNPDGNTFSLDESFGSSGLVGSSGSDDGEFDTPYDAAVSPDGTEIAVSDSGNHRIQRFSAADGAFLGAFGSSGSGVGQFNTPKGLTFDGSGYLYIADSGNNRIVLTLSSTVIGTSGSSGAALGQFQGAVNLCVGPRGIYTAETGNDRIQAFDPVGDGHGSSPTPFHARLSLSTEFEVGLDGPMAVAHIPDLLEEKIYIADTGNNRVIKATLPESSTPGDAWVDMKTELVTNGDIDDAITYFSSASADKYREAFLTIGLNKANSDLSEVGTLTPVFIDQDAAQYYFEQTIDGHLILFTVDFVKENGVWKILEF